jgi:UDP-glucose 4-epimerase
MKICVTGGAGFIGSHIVDALVEKKHDVIVVDNLSTGCLENLKRSREKINFVEADMGNEKLMMALLEGVDTVIHQAALTSVTRSMKNPLETHRQTLSASLNVLDCCRKNKVKRFIYAASSSAYGEQEGELKKEDMYPRPISPYAAAKVALEMYAGAYSRGFQLSTIGLRYFNVFGPRQNPNGSYAAVIPLFIKTILKGKAPVITGDGDQSRDFTYVANVVDANLLALEAINLPEACVLNIACGRQIFLPELVKHLNQVAGTSFEARFVSSRPGDIRHSLADISRARKILNYKVRIDFENGLEKTFEDAQRNWKP